MAQQSLLKATTITNLDATPPLQPGPNTGPGEMRTVSGTVSPVSGDQVGNGGTTCSQYQMVRVPSVAKIKNVWVESTISGAGSADLNIRWSDSTADGTTTTNQNTIPQISSANNKLFGSALSLVTLSRSSASYSQANWLYANTTQFPQGYGTNAAITAAIVALNAGYPTSGTLLTTESTNTPLWQMLGLGNPAQGDIGGWFDFVFYLTTAVTTGGILTLQVDYVV